MTTSTIIAAYGETAKNVAEQQEMLQEGLDKLLKVNSFEFTFAVSELYQTELDRVRAFLAELMDISFVDIDTLEFGIPKFVPTEITDLEIVADGDECGVFVSIGDELVYSSDRVFDDYDVVVARITDDGQRLSVVHQHMEPGCTVTLVPCGHGPNGHNKIRLGIHGYHCLGIWLGDGNTAIGRALSHGFVPVAGSVAG